MTTSGSASYLGPCLNSASFCLPTFLSISPWIEHAPFALWLVTTAKPATIVELGTHTGMSYFAFCEAVAAERPPTRCYAVDTWRGDKHTSAYGEEVFALVQAHNSAHYAGFSTL